jgi:hypothetical protein
VDEGDWEALAFLLSPMTVWSMAPVLEPEMVPEKSGCGADQPLAFVGSLEVR